MPAAFSLRTPQEESAARHDHPFKLKTQTHTESDMKRIGEIALMTLSILGAAFALSLATSHKVRAAVSALVTVSNTDSNPVPTTTAVPANPFFSLMQLSGTGAQSVGPGTGTLGVTQIVLTSSDSTVDQVNIYEGLLSGGTCGKTNNVEAATYPLLIVKVQPNSTLVLPFPTPLVFSPVDGYDNQPHTCLAASMPITGGNMIVTVNGFVN
jgi:hypothetical protein